MEAHCRYGAMHYFFTIKELESIFDANETAYIRSCDTWVVEDPNVIKTFAQQASQGVYEGRMWGRSVSPAPIKIVCYRAGTRVASLQVYDGKVITGSKITWSSMTLRYPDRLADRSILEPAGIQRLRLRWWCAFSIGGLHFDDSYPDPNHWCDAVAESLRQYRMSRGGEPMRRTYTDLQIAAMFRCPVARRLASADANESREEVAGSATRDQTVRSWVSDYAMNPDCGPNSPGDTVLLFETRAGWNQHGGPELFTFDNHDPKGGCVLLNDGTVKFIRTKEELAQLRWKP
ncbi:MAG: hypothetical protein JW993_13375 [Sedimentisphaerales bacterium]|nr:hypothetical protein [Sedimentisphaerales bacterium]